MADRDHHRPIRGARDLPSLPALPDLPPAPGVRTTDRRAGRRVAANRPAPIVEPAPIPEPAPVDPGPTVEAATAVAEPAPGPVPTPTAAATPTPAAPPAGSAPADAFAIGSWLTAPPRDATTSQATAPPTPAPPPTRPTPPARPPIDTRPRVKPPTGQQHARRATRPPAQARPPTPLPPGPTVQKRGGTAGARPTWYQTGARQPSSTPHAGGYDPRGRVRPPYGRNRKPGRRAGFIVTIVIVAIVVAIISDHHSSSSTSTTDSAGSGFASAGDGFGSAGDGFASAGSGFGSDGAGFNDTTTTEVPAPEAPPATSLTEDSLFLPENDSNAVPGFNLLGKDQTHDCAADVSPASAATLAKDGCQAILRGLYIDSEGDILVAEDLIVLATPADAASLNQTLEVANSDPVTATPVALSSIVPQPLNPDSLPSAPALAGAAGPVTTTDPGQAPGGDRFSTTSENQFVLINVGAYDNGRKASPDDERLGQATAAVISSVSNQLGQLGADGGTDMANITLGF